MVEFVINELKKINAQEYSKEQMRIVCPFHQDTDPSLSIHIGYRMKAGTWRCFGCGEHGSWNKLARQLNMALMTEENIAESDPFYVADKSFEPAASLDYELPDDIREWPIAENWRDLSGDFLRTMGFLKWWDEWDGVYRLLIPVRYGDRLHGYVGGKIGTAEKNDKGYKIPKYRNAKGEWAKTTWLGYDWESNPILKTNWKKYKGKVVVLVEGPYDWLQCVKHELPVIAILGTQNYSQKKKQDLISLNTKYIVTFFDGDSAGYKITDEVTKSLKGFKKVIKFKLPIKKQKKDQLDPGNCPEKYYIQLKEILNDLN
jgi:5S rRNA maturation endonuclease (ribonuclease M5)